MRKDYTKKLCNVIEINDSQIQDHLEELLRGTLEETISAMLDAEMMHCEILEISETRKDTKVGYYKREITPRAFVLSFISNQISIRSSCFVYFAGKLHFTHFCFCGNLSY